MVDVKDFGARVKATGGDADSLDDGQFEALVSVFGNEDSAGDVVTRGAFAKSLAAWEERGDPIPVIWSHEWSDPYAHIGHVLTAEETDDGLKVRGQLDLDNPKAEQVYRAGDRPADVTGNAASSSFVLMQFPEEDNPAFAYLENDRGAVYQEDPGDVERYTVMIDQLDEVAASVDDSRVMLDEAARSLK